MQVFTRNGELFADNIQVARLARNIGKLLLPDSTQDERLEVTAKLLGADSYFSLLKRSKDPDISTWTEAKVIAHVEKEAQQRGSRFPGSLPVRFNAGWKHLATALMQEALREIAPGELKLVALVGPTGCGKTLLANDMAARLGGFVMDLEQVQPFQLQCLPRQTDDHLLVLDQSSKPAPDIYDERGFIVPFRAAPMPLTTLSAFRQARRVRYTQLPLDRATDLFMGPTLLRGMLHVNPNLRIIMSFATEEEALLAFSSSGIAMGAAHAMRNWQAVHVVDLGEMKRKVIDLTAKQADHVT